MEIPLWLRQLKVEHLGNVYAMLQNILEESGKLPNTKEKETFQSVVEKHFLAAESVMLQHINSR